MIAPNDDHPDEEGNAEDNNEALQQGAETVTNQPMEPCIQQELWHLAISGEVPTILPSCTHMGLH